jgi:hypothetical protein
LEIAERAGVRLGGYRAACSPVAKVTRDEDGLPNRTRHCEEEQDRKGKELMEEEVVCEEGGERTGRR